MLIRSFRKHEAGGWGALRKRLWPGAEIDELTAQATSFLDGAQMPTIAAAFLAEEENGTPLGFIEIAIRSFSDGCDSMPVPHVEGWYVEPFARRHGVGRALMRHAEAWARDNGFTEMASDTETWNKASLTAHERCGFEEVERLIKLRKSLPCE